MAPPPTESELAAKVNELRGKVVALGVQDSYFQSDGYLISWLEEKKYKVEKCEAGIKKTFQWRTDNKMDSILTETFDHSWLPTDQEIVGHDIEHRPVFLMYPKEAVLDEKEMEAALKKALKDKPSTIRYAFSLLEVIRLAIAKSATAGGGGGGVKVIKSVTVIIDCKSVKITDYTSYAKLLFPLAKELLSVVEDHYPGFLHQAYVINAPKKLFRLLITMLKPVANSSLLDHVKIYGRKQEKWGPVLAAAVPKDQLLVRYGGANEYKVGSGSTQL